MNINRNNYEAYLVDYAEGNLAPELLLEMEQFLAINPDIREELELFLETPLLEKSLTFDLKDELKQIPFEKTKADSDYFQAQCVAYVEGLMPEAEVDFFMDLVDSDKERRKELTLFQKTLLPKEDVVFNEKIILKPEEHKHLITNSNIDEYCVACVEGWLNQSGLIALNNYIAANPEAKSTLELYQKTKLKPDLSLVYPDKLKLKRFNIGSLKTRRIISYAASAAAVLVFGVMAFYTAKLDNPSTLTSSMARIESVSDKEMVKETQMEKEPKVKEPITKVQQILHDPFGFEKVATSPASDDEHNEKIDRITVSPMEPIRLSTLDCKPCKELFETDPTLVAINLQNEKPIEQTTTIKNTAASNDIIWSVAQASISGLNKITNTKLKVEKEENTQKTKIQFKSKYFAFSTNVKKRNTY